MIIPVEDYELLKLTYEEAWNVWREIQAEADRIDEWLTDESRWKEAKQLNAWIKANTHEAT